MTDKELEEQDIREMQAEELHYNGHHNRDEDHHAR